MYRRIVVGVDDTECASAALRWAMAEAWARRAELVVVHAWEYPKYYGVPVNMERLAAATLAAAAAQVDDQPVEVRTHLEEGRPASALVRAAAGADLLVVGSRGRNPVVGMLLGSVSTECVHHAPCPVVVVPSAYSTLVAD
jgi:nucleotide-binding universal stress UspA family protein